MSGNSPLKSRPAVRDKNNMLCRAALQLAHQQCRVLVTNNRSESCSSLDLQGWRTRNRRGLHCSSCLLCFTGDRVTEQAHQARTYIPSSGYQAGAKHAVQGHVIDQKPYVILPDRNAATAGALCWCVGVSQLMYTACRPHLQGQRCYKSGGTQQRWT
jgi:hypothetical protein